MVADVKQTGRFLSAAQVAEILKVSARTVRRMAADGRLPFVDKLDGETGSYVFDPAVVAIWARQNLSEERAS